MGGGELRILKERERGSHRSFQVSIEEPLPTFHRQPFLGIALPATMLGQARDTARSIPEGRIMEIFPVWGTALAAPRLRDQGPCKSLQPCLARKARLKAWTSQKPSPPHLFGFTFNLRFNL